MHDASAPRSQPRLTSILVVDDKRDSANLVAMVCRAAGHDSYVAFSGAQALTAAARIVPHIVVLDLFMPAMDGFEVAAAIKAAPGFDDPFILALTGLPGPEVERQTKAAGFDFHLTKPLDSDFLVSIVAKLSLRARPMRNSRRGRRGGHLKRSSDALPGGFRVRNLQVISLETNLDVRYWMQHFSVSRVSLLLAVDAVGSDTAAVAAFLELWCRTPR